MDPITTAIVAAVAAGAAGGGQEVAQNALVDAYNGLKALIKSKFSKNEDLVESIEKVEKKPESKGRRETLAEEIESAGASNDEEILKQAQELLKNIDPKQVNLGKFNIQAENIQNITQAENIGTLNQTFGDFKPSK